MHKIYGKFYWLVLVNDITECKIIQWLGSSDQIYWNKLGLVHEFKTDAITKSKSLAIPLGTRYFVPYLENPEAPTEYVWEGTEVDLRAFSNNLIYFSKQEAIDIGYKLLNTIKGTSNG